MSIYEIKDLSSKFLNKYLREIRECMFKCKDDTYLANSLELWRSRIAQQEECGL